MLKKISLTGTLTDDCEGLRFEMPALYKRALFGWRGKKLEFDIRIFRSLRSEKQMRYLWGYVVPRIQGHVWDFQGEWLEDEEIYAYIHTKILGYKLIIRNVMGVDMMTMEGKRMSKMTTVEFNQAVKKIQDYYARPDERDEPADPSEPVLIINDPVGDNTLVEMIQAELRKNEEMRRGPIRDE